MFSGKLKWAICLMLGFAHFSVLASANEEQNNTWLKDMVATEQATSELVSLGVAVKIIGEPVVTAVAGERKINSNISVSVDDKWHLGSITKSMTATMIARLVEHGIIRWTTTIGEVFKNDKFHPAWRDVTLHMLLTHTSGAKANFSSSIQKLHPEEGTQRHSQRIIEVLKVLAKKPQSTPGQEFEYSNLGYTIAGLMAAIKTGKSWEDLIRDELFQPLNLNSGGFGHPVDSDGTLEQPRGHKDSWFSGPQAVATDADNSPIMGPAGSIHMSLADLSAYAAEHLKGRQGESKFLTQTTFAQLHSMTEYDYAYGWIAARKTQWVDHKEVLYHNGSNTYWYALLVMIPELNLSIAVTTNDGNLGKAQESAWRLVKQIKANMP